MTTKNTIVQMVSNVINNLALTRQQLVNKLIDPNRDIDGECGYPVDPDFTHYTTMYEKEGIASRVVSVLPEESWTNDPILSEDEEETKTKWEEEVDKLVRKHNIWGYLERVDVMSGIGEYGVLLMGFGDGGKLDQPVANINEKTGEPKTKASKGEVELLYLRCFDQGVVKIDKLEGDVTSPRYGLPVMYSIEFNNDSDTGSTKTTQKVHWTRILHVADNRLRSEVLGTPRMKRVYNRLYDLRKVLGGSGEMFWKGGFPGLSFELAPGLDQAAVEIDKDSLREEFEKYTNSLQRYLAVEGLTTKSLAPQVADPSTHFETHLKAICISLGIPYRIFMGTEEAKLAGGQDSKAWNTRVQHRQEKYIIPMLVRPFIDRLMAVGVLSWVDEYKAEFPDLHTPSDDEKASVAEKKARALASFATSGSDAFIPPKEFFTMILNMTDEEAAVIEKALKKYVSEIEDDEERIKEAADAALAAEKANAKRQQELATLPEGPNSNA